jgi:hypothetical protein
MSYYLAISSDPKPYVFESSYSTYHPYSSSAVPITGSLATIMGAFFLIVLNKSIPLDCNAQCPMGFGLTSPLLWGTGLVILSTANCLLNICFLKALTTDVQKKLYSCNLIASTAASVAAIVLNITGTVMWSTYCNQC